MMSLLSRFTRLFLQGILIIAPLALTSYLLYVIFSGIQDLLKISGYPFITLGIVIVSLTFIGFLSSTFLVRPIIQWGERLIKGIPLVNIIYTSVKDLLEAFVGNKKKFSEPVIVTLNKDNGLKRIGFITSKDVKFFDLDENTIAVYFPHSYNISGNVYFVPKDHVKPLDLPAADVMKFIVSGGVSTPL
jgi:uncharacterized membrane protein